MYYFSNARVKSANRQFSNIPNDYELSLNQQSSIVKCRDSNVANEIPKPVIDPVSIAQIANMQINSIVGKS